MDLSDTVYRGGFYSILRGFEKSQRPYQQPLNYLPDVECDLTEMIEQRVPQLEVEPDTLKKATIERKHLEFQKEFQGSSHLLYVHAMLIANLRRNSPPPEALELFLRIWREQGAWLAEHLPIRWRISAATTFADCGRTMEQRALGMGLSVLFDSIKLHDTERRLTGRGGDQPFDVDAKVERPGIAFDMQPYALTHGDLDRNMLARLWALAERDEVIFPLAKSMLFEVMTDQRSIFARMQKIKDRRSNEQ